MESLTIKVTDMRARGKNGYVAKILGDGSKNFLRAIHQTGYGTSAKTLTFEIKEDGIYEVSDANFGGRKKNVTFYKIESGRIVGESEEVLDFLVTDDLPELQGSEAQILWADQIRKRFILKLRKQEQDLPKWIYKVTEATKIINNREKLQ
jgi:hypothetical protein